VLHALMSFHPEVALTLEALGGTPAPIIVFPSNRMLGARAHGMAEQSLRRHLAILCDKGFIQRRDSPNGKRYQRRLDGEGAHIAFGFDLAPLVLRATEIMAMAESVERDERRMAMLKERISLHRRDIGKLLALLAEMQGMSDAFERCRLRFLALCIPLRSLAAMADFESLADRLHSLQGEITALITASDCSQQMSGNDVVSERHISESNNRSENDLEPDLQGTGGNIAEAPDAQTLSEDAPTEVKSIPLGLVLDACPDIAEVAPAGAIRNWQDLTDAARMVRPMLGISPDAEREAALVFGAQGLAVVIAAILQRSEQSSEAKRHRNAQGAETITVNGSPAIRSAGGYLRSLTEKGQTASFSPANLLMALIGQRQRQKLSTC
jgi:replication initiation protein RepC